MAEKTRGDDPDVEARVAARAAGDGAPELLVVVPCLNEEATVEQVVSGIPTVVEGVGAVRVVVFDDGSTDRTAELAAAAGASVVSNPRNLGLGRTFRRAANLAVERGVGVMVNIDGDGQFDPADIPKLVEPVLRGEAEMVTASRFLDPELEPHMPRVKRWGNAWMTWIVWLITFRRYRDVSCGFRAFSREALLRLNLFGSFTYTQETFIDLLFKGLTVKEVPVKVRGTREFGVSRLAASIPRYAARSLKIMFRAAISYRPFRFFATIAAVFLGLGVGLLGFLLWHYLETGRFSPHIWAGFVGGSLGFLGLSTLVLGFVGDILVRMRLNQEEILYRMRRAGNRPAAGNESISK